LSPRKFKNASARQPRVDSVDRTDAGSSTVTRLTYAKQNHSDVVHEDAHGLLTDRDPFSRYDSGESGA
jgi:hypothetical protein